MRMRFFTWFNITCLFLAKVANIFCGYVIQIATIIAVYADWSFARVKGIGWGWAGVIWLYSIVFYVPLDLMKFAIRYILSGKAWVNMLENKVCLSLLNTFSWTNLNLNWCCFVFTKNVFERNMKTGTKSNGSQLELVLFYELLIFFCSQNLFERNLKTRR